MLEHILTLVAIAAAWDTARRYADAYHNRARLSCVEDVAHEAMTLAEGQAESYKALLGMAQNRDKAVTDLERRLDVQSKALAAQGETLIEHGRKLTNFSLASSRGK